MSGAKVITIDGPAGVGKSTLARMLAEKLRIPYLNTGAMFRCLAIKLGEKAVKEDESTIAKNAAQFSFSLRGSGPDTQLLCNGAIPGDEIRGEYAATLASALATNSSARALLANAQREIAKKTPLVAEGRDMGTAVFPDARLKFFLDARAEARALRRWKEIAAKGQAPTLAEIEKTIRERDERDRNRPIAPLKPAADAIIIDTSNLTPEEVLALMLDRAADFQKESF